MGIDRQAALRLEYSEASSTFRLLTDIRFKLLAFLPAAAGAAAALLKGAGNVNTLAISLFGLAVTVGLVTYNARNDQLYDTLVARLAAIERRLGLPDGAFANRPRPWFAIRVGDLNWQVHHRTAVAAIYYSSIALWLFGALAALSAILDLSGILDVRRSLVDLAALAVAGAVTWQGARIVGDQKKHTKAEMKILAGKAVELAKSNKLRDLAVNEPFIATCAALSSEERDDIKARALFLADLDSTSSGQYFEVGPDMVRASQIVATITDLAPEWVYDCATGRR